MKILVFSAHAADFCTRAGGTIAAGGDLVLGQDQDLPPPSFESGQELDGLLDDVRIYPRVLTPEEIAALASMGE